MTLPELMAAFQWAFLLYFLALGCGYLLLNLCSALTLWRYMQWRSIDTLSEIYSGLEPPVSVLVPAHNEEVTIAASVRALLQQSYPHHEVLVINDGSNDRTLQVLIDEFDLKPYPAAYWDRLKTQPVHAAYRSATHPNLRVIDKAPGGKADSLNAGINDARYPLFCCIDADSILQRDSLSRVVQPFMDDARTVAAGGTVRVANGCEVSDGFLVKTGLPRNPLVLIQIVEYLRAFLFGRLGWSPLNALLIISGAFGVFDKEKVVAVGGYRTDTVGEDMELVMRLHRHLRRAGVPYRITFVPDPICWTEAPRDFRTLARQRIRWQRGLSESLMMNLGLLCRPWSGAAGWLAFPFLLVFEWLGPLIEVTGYLFMIAAFLFGFISIEALGAFFLIAIGVGMLLSISALLLEEASFHIYRRPNDPPLLFLAILGESFGYRQLNSFWRLIGLLRWAFKGQRAWGEMKRSGEWQRPEVNETRQSREREEPILRSPRAPTAVTAIGNRSRRTDESIKPGKRKLP